MMQLLSRHRKLTILVFLVPALLILGVPVTWITIASLLVIDFAAITRLIQDSSPRGGRRASPMPIWALSLMFA